MKKTKNQLNIIKQYFSIIFKKALLFILHLKFMKNKKAHIINLGCRLNIYEGEIIKSLCKKNELKNITIINSCAVTDGAEKKVLYEIRRAKRKNPSGKVIVTGCAAQINPDKFSQKNDVDIVLGNKEKLDEQIWKNLKNINKINVKIFRLFIKRLRNLASLKI